MQKGKRKGTVLESQLQILQMNITGRQNVVCSPMLCFLRNFQITGN